MWSHRFAVLHIASASMARALGTTPDDPRVARAVDAYLENWSDLAPLDSLRALLPAARRLSPIHRALSWRRVLDAVPINAVEPEWHDGESWWIQDFRSDRPRGDD
ncbi:conserved hypothetical protein [Nostocoides australiense Ben110]|uniref:Uncharacterized protein n=1 Tax=Nostocoides australiense Ben110 TaxID=1193182 RepID=W6JUE1_9MICO|nr:conserved hypothetical protein [Tetrasphaera australiensis Ben110]